MWRSCLLQTLVATAVTVSCSESKAHSSCALSTEAHPRGALGLQLIYADDPQSWAWADDLRVSWLRIEMRWDWIEPHQGQFDASYADRVMALAKSHQQKIMLLFNHVPHWAQRDTELLPVRAATSMAWLARRIGARVSAWEIFNEPNLPGYGWPLTEATTQESATIYAKTLAAVSSAIRDLDKRAFIISAGLSPQENTESYARWILRLTPTNCFDAVGLHPYGERGKFAAIQRNVAALAEQERQPQKPVWFTEYSTDTDTDTDRAKLINSLGAEMGSAPITFYFAERDLGRITGQYGLRRHDGSAKPEYDLFKRISIQTPHSSP